MPLRKGVPSLPCMRNSALGFLCNKPKGFRNNKKIKKFKVGSDIRHLVFLAFEPITRRNCYRISRRSKAPNNDQNFLHVMSLLAYFISLARLEFVNA
jgi:hypothetical protein